MEETKKLIKEYCDDMGIEYREFTPYQIRLTNEDQKIVDIYPVNNKFHIISCNARGQFTDISSFLQFIFG